MAACILIVDDDPGLVRMLQINLNRQGYHVLSAADGPAGLRMMREQRADLVMLDIALPGMNGMEVCQRIRQFSNAPILIMTAHAVSEAEIVHGLNLGADEYLIKPMKTQEMLARVRALLRRAGMLATSVDNGCYNDAYLSIDLTARQVRINGVDVRLTPTEFKLLATFIQHRGEVLTFERLLIEVWGDAYTTEHHYPRIYVSHLRRKIEPDAQQPTYIQNEYGVGYRFVGDGG